MDVSELDQRGKRPIPENQHGFYFAPHTLILIRVRINLQRDSFFCFNTVSISETYSGMNDSLRTLTDNRLNTVSAAKFRGQFIQIKTHWSTLRGGLRILREDTSC